jgi:hypothetical protein
MAQFDDTLTLFDANSGIDVLHKVIRTRQPGDYAFPARVAFTRDGRLLLTNHCTGQISIFQSDPASCTESERRADRRQEAAAAAFGHHLRAIRPFRDRPDSVGFWFHAARLDRLPIPNPLLAERWSLLKGAAGRSASGSDNAPTSR